MRLLSCKTKDEFELTTFTNEDDLPRYAILSHTWNDGQEVTYDELVAGVGKEKIGYTKIRFCGERAVQDGLQYFWVDTCCIDRRDHVELSAAINSMFRWNQRADKCYVYLSDVQVPAEVNDIQTFRSTWEATFRSSRWFTRGWTLQELLAPGIVEFFSRDERILGSKISLEKEIHDITQIPYGALRNHNVCDFSIDERMRWVEKRKTTLKEDRVYCLLGIFGIFLPLIYGEGEDHAFHRLRKEIAGEIGSLGGPKVARVPNMPVSSLLPFSRNESFVGRDSHLRALEQWLYRSHTHRRMSVYGLGGCGKTALALEFAYRILAKNSEYLVFWVLALSRESFELACREIGHFLHIPGITDDNADVKQLLKNGLSSGSFGDWLMIVDNADDTSVLFDNLDDEPQLSRLISYLPQSDRGSILFTTRGRKTAERLTQSSILELEDMSQAKAEAKQLMALQVSNQGLLDDDNAINDLLQLLTYLPLAIIDADTEAELFSKHFEDPSRYGEMESTIAKTWYISFNQILKQDQLAADYLSFMACIDRINIPLSLLPAGDSMLQRIEAIGTLTGYAFITERQQGLQQSQGERFFDVHRLVHMASVWWLKEHNKLASCIEKTLSRLENLLPYGGHDRRDVWVNYLSHAIYLADPQNRLSETARVLLLDRIGECQLTLGQYSAAEMTYRQALLLSEKVLEKEHPGTLNRMAKLAAMYWHRGRWKEAEALGIEVLKIEKRVLGNEHPNTLISMANLASAYWDQGRWKEAEELGIEVIKIRKRVLGDEHPDTLTSMANLASTYTGQRRWKEAEELGIEVLKIKKRVLGDKHPKTLTSMANLASTYRDQERWKEAEELGIEVFKIRKRVLGDEHPSTLISMANLAVTYHRSGKCESAVALIRDVIPAQERCLGLSHPDTVSSKAALEKWLRNNSI
ncbi:hypothetical protein MMC17_009570 [Xylographa soralifera]|nr:hypothetical protein [Xylographa soralifera]